MNVENIRRKYKRPPVIEALCEIHFLESQTDSTFLGLFYEKVKEQYPIKKEVFRTNFDVQFVQGALSEQKIGLEPLMRFFNDEQTELLQVSNNLLTINRLPPYVNYESFVESIRKAFKVYKDIANPRLIDRIGLRYINHIFIPKVLVNLEEYFTYLPKIEEIYYQIQLNLELKPFNEGHTTFATIRSLPNENNEAAYLLDIYNSFRLNQELDTDTVIERIGDAHENIERIFETAITPKTRELFEEEKND